MLRVRSSILAAFLLSSVVSAGSQVPLLRVVSAGPTGDLGQIADADEVRIIFSEPMVSLGTVQAGSAPSWVRISPAAAGTFYWSGTRTLMFSPDAETPLPFATIFTVRVDGSAAGVSGRNLGTPYEFTFTTPVVRLLSAEWYRKSARFDSPAVIALRFNQRVRPGDVLAHTRAALTPHPWTAPALSAEAREFLRGSDRDGLDAFDAKVASVQRVVASQQSFDLRLAESWNEERFAPAPERVVLETTGVPPTDGWVTVAVDAAMPSPAGPATPATPQSTVVRLEPTFFVNRTGCTTGCNPSGYNPIQTSVTSPLGVLARAITIADVTDGAREQPVARLRDTVERPAQISNNARVQDLGFAPQPPARVWRLRMDPTLEASDGQRLGYPWVGLIENIHEQPGLGFGGGVWESGGGATLPLAARNVQSVSTWTMAMSLDSVMPRLIQLRRAQQAAALPAVAPELKRLTMAPDIAQAHGLDLRRLLSPAGTGLISAAVSPSEVLPGSVPLNANNNTVNALVQVTNLGVHVKDSAHGSLIFVTRLDNGAVVPDARVSVIDAANQTRWRGVTGADGVALVPPMTMRPPDRMWDLTFVVVAEKDGDVAFVGSDWNESIQPYNWRLRYQPTQPAVALRGSVFTDRGVYRETDEVHLKAVLRDDTNSGMRMAPDGGTFDVVVNDSRGREADRRTIRVNRWSSAEWTWRVPANAALGDYEVTISRAGAPASNGDTISGQFLVAAYRRPDFRVDATLESEPAVLGSTLHATVDAKYLFGGALGSRPVRWWFRRTLQRSPPVAVLERYPEARYAIGYVPSPEIRRPVEPPLPQKTETLAADGRISVELPTTAEGDLAYSYSFEGDVEDPSGQHIANRASLVVHPASIYVAVSRPPMFVDSKTGVSVGVLAVDLSGRPVPGVSIDVSLWREQWSMVRRPENPFSATWERQEIAAGSWTRTSAAAEAPLAIPVREGGKYIIRAVARDAAGRQTRTDVSFYATGPGVAAWRSEGNRIDLTPERQTWKPGERARILIQSPWERATALLTTEREGVRSHRRFEISSTQDTVEVPITDADVPNLFVSVVLVKGRTATEIAADGTDGGRPSFRIGYTELTVDDESKRLRVDVSADRDEYRPHAPARVTVKTSSRAGRPVAGEVTLWAMDYGLLSLTEYTTPDLVKAIYAPKPLQVTSEDNRQRLISRAALVADQGGVVGGIPAPPPAPAFGLAQGQMGAAGGRGGGGGGFGGDGLVNVSAATAMVMAESVETPAAAIDVRRDFRPLVFWLGSTTTGADGVATTTVTLPDSLTTYRIMAVAGSDLSHFGFAEREIRVTKPLTLLPAFPRFMSKGDRASFGAVVTNSSGQPGQAVVTVSSLDPATLAFSGGVTRRFSIAPGASEPVRFDALAGGSGSARVRMTVTMGADTDAFEMPLLVTVPLRPETVAAYGDTTASATEALALPKGILPGAGGLTVNLASTALVGLGEGARYLTEYPYECAEQRASRALALLLASDLGGAFRLQGIEPDKYRSEGVSALNSLYGYQCGSGGFSLWAGSCASESAYLTAYVLHVMRVAGTQNVTVDRQAIDRALNYLQQQLRQPPPEIQWYPVWAASQAYSVKVLAEFGRNPGTEITRLSGVADRLPVFALSYLADALAATNDRGPRYQAVLRRLTNALRIDADRAHVEEVDDAALAWLWNTNVRATAVVLDGFSRRKDDATLVPPLVRWLVAARTNGRWGTTHENAGALEALVSYYRAFESDVPQMNAAVKVGAVTAGTAAFNGRSTTAQQIRVSMPDLLKQVAAAAAPVLTVSKTGTGRVYYTARVQYYAPEPPEAVDRGFNVERRYAPFVSDGTSPASLSFNAGDLIRVTVAVTLRGEGRYLALTDPLPAGFEPLEGWFRTTASDLARQATRAPGGSDWRAVWRRGTFDHVEKHDDRVVAFATRLGSGRHEFSYLVRATTAGTFTAAGARVEAMYAPELTGRSAATTVNVK